MIPSGEGADPKGGVCSAGRATTTQDAEHWIFGSDNPAYEPIRVAKDQISHPILGTMVEKFVENDGRP